MSELKPCPFCTSLPVWNNSARTYSLQCPLENCPGRPSTDDYFSRDKAIAAWNTRADIDLMPHFQKARDRIKELEASPWVSVDERLPEHDQQCICIGPDRVDIDVWCQNSIISGEWFTNTDMDYTHWSPIPPLEDTP